MSDQYVGEIRPAGFSFAPVGWLQCNGQLVSISEYEVLFDLIGTTYGGDGQTTFGLPDLRGRGAIHTGNGGGGTYPLGANGGSEAVTLNVNQLAAHAHVMPAQSATPTSPSPSGTYFSASTQTQFGATAANSPTAALLTANGGGQPHDNLMPYQCVNYIIATAGNFPSVG